MTQKVSIKDRDALKELATSLGLEFPNNMPTGKLVDLIQEKIDTDGLDIQLDGGTAKPASASIPSPMSTPEQNVVTQELTPLVDEKSTYESPDDMDHTALVSVSGLVEKLKGGVDGKDHKLDVKIFSSGSPSKTEDYKVEGGPNYVMVGEGENLGFIVQGTALFEVTKTITETVPDPDGEEGDTKEVEKEVVEDELRAIVVNDYFDSVKITIGYTVKEKEEEVPPVKPEPSETDLINGINTLEGHQFEFDKADNTAYIQISDVLLRALKMNVDTSEASLTKFEGPRLVKEYAFFKAILEKDINFEIYDARFNNAITKEQYEEQDYYHDVEAGEL